MADVYEQNLASKSTLTTSDYIRVVGSDNVSYKQLVSDVAKKVIETYAGSTLAGSAQSVQSAINALNSNEIRSVTMSMTIAANGNSNTNLKTLIDADMPSGKRFLALAGFTTNDVYLNLVACRYHNSNYSLQVRNTASSERTSTITVSYLCGC